MQVEFRTRPIDVWPGERTEEADRKGTPFRTGYQASLDILERELRYLVDDDYVLVTIGLDITDADIRLDGLPRASARPLSPGVILSFDSRFGPLKYACDRFVNNKWRSGSDWHENFRAIALGLEALRKVERYAITRRGEQYAGFKTLPGSGESSTTMTAEAAAKALLDWSGLKDVTVEGILSDRNAFRRAYRTAAAAVHPDREDGNAHKFHAVQECEKIIDAHLS